MRVDDWRCRNREMKTECEAMSYKIIHCDRTVQCKSVYVVGKQHQLEMPHRNLAVLLKNRVWPWNNCILIVRLHSLFIWKLLCSRPLDRRYGIIKITNSDKIDKHNSASYSNTAYIGRVCAFRTNGGWNARPHEREAQERPIYNNFYLWFDFDRNEQAVHEENCPASLFKWSPRQNSNNNKKTEKMKK